MTYGVFSKEDQYGNTITAIRRDCLKDYLLNRQRHTVSLFDLFRQFNNGFSFGQWLKALDAIKEMHQNEWSQWRQTEWAGWFLEYKFNKFTVEENVTDRMRYVGCSLKQDGELDFDIRFERDDFYGDLKASDISKTDAPGNDQHNLMECIYRHDKFWYVIYEHQTVKENEDEISRARVDYIKSVTPSYYKEAEKEEDEKNRSHRK